MEGGIYGNEIDREAEKEYLLDAFVSRKREIHTPVYSKMAKEQGSDDIGDTYIEVDMTDQKLYYYVDGELVIETPVVTGNTSLRRGTPSGTNYVYAKQRNRTLRGPDYASFVKYWIPCAGISGSMMRPGGVPTAVRFIRETDPTAVSTHLMTRSRSFMRWWRWELPVSCFIKTKF